MEIKNIPIVLASASPKIRNVPIILASASPRRKELLSLIADSFEIIPADIDETLPDGIPAINAPEYLATQKALHIAKDNPDKLVIGCDTVVIIKGKILGKPKDKSEAFEMLSELSGDTHVVASGVCLCYKGKSISFTDKTLVDFYRLSADEINEYIDTGDPFDKAGGYGIQSKGGFMVKSINGDYNNVVGLPMARLLRKANRFLAFSD